MQLARCEYVEQGQNTTAIGNSGAGNTRVALGLATCQRELSLSQNGVRGGGELVSSEGLA